MDYLKQNEPPVREDRIKARSCFGGCYKDLIEAPQCGCMKNRDRRFSQTLLCQSDFALPMVNEIKDSVVIKHAPIGCGSMNMYYGSPDEERTYVRTINTNLGENELVTGGVEALEKAVCFADKEYHPKQIFIMNSCVPTLMGDDLDGLVSKIQKRVNAIIVPVHCAGFKSKVSASGYDAVYHGLLRYLIGKGLKSDDLPKKEPYTVNLINTVSVSQPDQDELIRLLSALGLKVQTIVYGATQEDFVKMLSASLNVCICATHDDYLVNGLKDIYGIPFMIKNIPIGIENTGKWIRAIAKHFGKIEEAEKIIAKEEETLNRALEPFRRDLQGKTACVNGGEVRVLATAAMLESIGIKVLGIEAKHHDGFAQELIDEFPGDKKNTLYSAGHQPFEKANIINSLNPDLYVGHNGQCAWPAKQGVPVFTLFLKPYQYFGYVGTYNFARSVHRVLKNTAFFDNLKENTKLPYTEQWYEQSPFSMQ